MSGRRVVLFDLGGVVFESPIMTIRRFSKDRGFSDLNVFLGSSASWARLERSELAPGAFAQCIFDEARARGFEDGVKLGVQGWAELLRTIGGHSIRPSMVTAIRLLREAGFTVAALTNNFSPSDPAARAALEQEQAPVRSLFHAFVESSVVGLRKPDPAFYELALRAVGCKAEDAIFLDDIGKNLKSAQQMGIHTIHVKNDTEETHLEALEELQRLVGIALVDRSKL